eukprot:GEZU01002407.1.p1 GENE.GEZU01002407.1~~GEZU01002407.1.p1  ORF type:complete len:264 (-),score=90.12 GEZU01002407.1:163-954(-)
MMNFDRLFNDPFREMRRMERAMTRDMNRMLRDFERGFGEFGYETPLLTAPSTTAAAALPSGRAGAMTSWVPNWAVSETDNQYIIRCELPGVSKNDINIELDRNHLRISGEKKLEKSEENERFFTEERSYGYFERRLPLPPGIDPQQIQATYDSGMLTVTVPKPQSLEQQRTRKIKIAEGSGMGGGAAPQGMNLENENNPANVSEDLFQYGQDMDKAEWEREENLTKGLEYHHHRNHVAENWKGPDPEDIYEMAKGEVKERPEA